jgi:hypothetical protein
MSGARLGTRNALGSVDPYEWISQRLVKVADSVETPEILRAGNGLLCSILATYHKQHLRVWFPQSRLLSRQELATDNFRMCRHPGGIAF